MKIKTIILMLVAAMTLTMQTAFGQGIIPSNWRNEQTGDWVIGFYDDFAIYDCKFWNYKEKTQSGDSFTFVLESDGKQITVTADNAQNNVRNITINGNKAAYSVIMGETLPDYPAKDTRTGFKDSRYKTDTVTLVGWLRDMPKRMRRRSDEYVVGYNDILLNEQVSAYGKIDAIGRFEVKIPLQNSSEVFLDWKRMHLRTLFEAGETYFLLCDFSRQQIIFMGDNSRLQNETLMYPIEWINGRLDGENNDDAAALQFFERLKQEKATVTSHLERCSADHPTLSQRYVDYLTENYSVNAVRNLMQGRFFVKNWRFPKEIIDYANQQWQFCKRPYTLCRDFGMFQRDYIDYLVRERYYIPVDEWGCLVMREEVHPQILRLYRDKGKVAITDDELNFLEEYNAFQHEGFEKGVDSIDEATKSKFKDARIRDSLIHSRADIKAIISTPLTELFMTLNILDSVGCDNDLRDIVLANCLYRSIDHTRQPLDKTTMDYFEEIVSLPAAKDFLREQQAKYIAIQDKDINNNPSLKTSAGLENMSDGEQLLRKITEPYRGKLILLDVWGTWCGACRTLLAESQEEYERLKDYDLVFLYLCNRSSDKSWKNVIKQYNLTGDNIVHYNLPEAQQSAIEHFLGVTGYPTYNLIDRNGDVLNVNVDVFDLESVAKLLEQVK